MQIIKAPEHYSKFIRVGNRIIFLAGSIEMGIADKWQDRIAKELEDLNNIIVLNPRRDDWTSSWEQTINNPMFREQVEWELAAMSDADVVAMYFDPKTTSPITLLELGLHAKGNRLIVCCPEGFFRKGNVEVVCNYYGTPLFDEWEPFVEAVRDEIA